MRRLLRLGAHLILAVGWLLFGAGILLYAGELSGGLRWILERELERRLGPLGEELELERAELRWFAPALELSGLQLGEDGRVLRLDRVSIALPSVFAWRPERVRIEARDGHLLVSSALRNGLRGLLAGRAPDGSRRRAADMPAIQVENMHVDLESDGGALPLGRVDADLRQDPTGWPVLTGRLIPSLAARADGPGEIYLEGRLDEAGAYEVRAHAIDLPLSTELAPEEPELAPLAPFRPHGVLSLDARARGGADGEVPLEIRARFSLADGSLSLPDTAQRVEAVTLEGQAWFDAGEGRDPFDPRAWSAGLRGVGRWDEASLEASLLWGRAARAHGRLAEGWLHAERLLLGAPLADLARASPRLTSIVEAAALDGTAELWLGAHLPDAPSGPLAEPALALELALTGNASVAYVGPRSRRGERDVGFPLPCDGVAGRLVLGHDPARLRPLLLGMIGLSGRHGAATARGDAVVASMPVDLPPYRNRGRAEIDLRLAGEHIPIGPALEAAFAGLRGLVPQDELWKRYNPTGGTLSGELRLVRRADTQHDAASVRLALEDVGLTWTGLPVPMLGMRGTVEFRDDGDFGRGVAFAGQGALRTAKALRVAGRFQTDPGAAAAGGIDVVEVGAQHLSLSGDDLRVLGEVVEGVAASMERFGARGFADAAYRRVRALPGGAARTAVEVTPRDPARLTPEPFPMVTGDVRGRVLVGVLEPAAHPGQPGGGAPAIDVRVTPLVGTWGPEVQVAFLADQVSDGAARIAIFGAGIDPSSKSLLGSLAEALPGEAGFAKGAFTVDGRLDFDGVLGPESDTDELTGSYRFFLRDNRLTGTEHFQLDRLHGKLELRGGSLFGERLTARLGRTPVELTEASFTSTGRGYRFRTRLAARGVPLDREHLQAFIGEETLTPLLDELELQGEIDIPSGLLAVEGPPEGAKSIEFKGSIVPRRTSLKLGLPLSVDSASVTLERLSFEHGQVRAWAVIEDLEGLIADRDLGPADMLVTYVQPRLSIDNIDGRFEGGRVRPLGGGTAAGGTAFSIDLVPPYPFQLGMSLRDVELAGLLQGLFASNIATRGTLSCDLRLTGDTEHLLDLSGTGTFELHESRLWSIPVFRALFSQLGLDSTAVFDSMRANVRLRDGVLRTNDIEVHSPLLQLVGSGTVDLDGSLRQDLEVRYSILDYLGPLRRLFYTIQNRLVSVAIRGDLNRPRVLLKSPFTSLFVKSADSYRALPLPDFAPLPPRF